jgi:XisI protein
MDRITIFRQAIMSVMDNYIEEHTRLSSLKEVQYEPITDNEHLRFQLVLVGRHEHNRIHNLMFHADIINDKICIQDDNLEYSVAERLGDRGIPKKDIVLAYFSPSHREYTEYAVS